MCECRKLLPWNTACRRAGTIRHVQTQSHSEGLVTRRCTLQPLEFRTRATTPPQEESLRTERADVFRTEERDILLVSRPHSRRFTTDSHPTKNNFGLDYVHTQSVLGRSLLLSQLVFEHSSLFSQPLRLLAESSQFVTPNSAA
jgi:hypothetical protein